MNYQLKLKGEKELSEEEMVLLLQKGRDPLERDTDDDLTGDIQGLKEALKKAIDEKEYYFERYTYMI